MNYSKSRKDIRGHARLTMKKANGVLNRTWIPVVAGLLLLLLATSPPTFGAKKSLALEGCDRVGSEAVVAVSNSSGEARRGTVTVAAKVDGALVVKSASVTLSANSLASVKMSFGSQLQDIITVGLREEPSPF